MDDFYKKDLKCYVLLLFLTFIYSAYLYILEITRKRTRNENVIFYKWKNLMTRRNFSSNCVITTVFDESKISNSSKYNEKYFLYKIVIEKYFHNQYFRFIEYKN